jgi:hypothetical protein
MQYDPTSDESMPGKSSSTISGVHSIPLGHAQKGPLSGPSQRHEQKTVSAARRARSCGATATLTLVFEPGTKHSGAAANSSVVCP